MSLDVYLERRTSSAEPSRMAIFVQRDGSNDEVSREEWDRLFPGREPTMCQVGGHAEITTLFTKNITHNLTRMADEVGIYKVLWQPEEVGITTAAQLIDPLVLGLARLKAHPIRCRRHNPPNGWGSYEGLIEFVEAYLDACRTWPDAIVNVSR